MAGIDDDHRPGIARRLGGVLAGCRGLGRLRQVVVDRRRTQEGFAIDRREIDDEAGRLALGGIDHEGAGNPHRSRDVDDDPRAPLHDDAEAERLDDAAAALPGLRRELEIDLGDIDHHAIGIGDGEGAHIDLAGEVDDEPGLLVVTGEPGLARDRRRLVHRGYRHRHLGAGRNRA